MSEINGLNQYYSKFINLALQYHQFVLLTDSTVSVTSYMII